MVATAPRPVKDMSGTGNAFMVSRKAAAWADENGYSNLLLDLADFTKAYKAAHIKPDYYQSQTPERLMEMIDAARTRMEKAKAALSAKIG